MWYIATAVQPYKGTYCSVGNLEYDSVNVIGHGSSGTVVYSGKFRVGEVKNDVAIKRLTKKVNAGIDKSAIPSEFDILKKVKHPNILHYICFESDNNYT